MLLAFADLLPAFLGQLLGFGLSFDESLGLLCLLVGAFGLLIARGRECLQCLLLFLQSFLQAASDLGLFLVRRGFLLQALPGFGDALFEGLNSRLLFGALLL